MSGRWVIKQQGGAVGAPLGVGWSGRRSQQRACMAPQLPAGNLLPCPFDSSCCALCLLADEAFEVLLEVTGAAGAEDMAAGAPGVNVQHSGGWHATAGPAGSSCVASCQQACRQAFGWSDATQLSSQAFACSQPPADRPSFLLQARAPPLLWRRQYTGGTTWCPPCCPTG